MPHGSPRDPAKERFWRQTLRDFQASGLTVRAFCADRGLSEPSFYLWRRTIADRDRAADAAASVPRFVPVRVAAEPAGSPAPACGATSVADPSAPPGWLELVLPSGHRVRVPPGFDPRTLRHLLAALAEGPPC
jgi:hypothetical protein